MRRWFVGMVTGILCVGTLALAPPCASAEGLGLRDKLKARAAEGLIDDGMKESLRGRQAQASLSLRKAEVVIDELALKYGRNHADVKRLYGMLADARGRVQGSSQASAPSPTGTAGASQGKETAGSTAPRTRQAGSSAAPGGRSDKMARLARAKGGNIDATIDGALKSSDLVDQVTLENQKRNNLVAARDKLRQAKESIDRLSAQMGASDPEVQRLSKRLEDARTQIYARHGAQLEAMLASVQAPQNVYKGSDRGEWEQRIRALWTKLRPNDQILGVRFAQANWVKGEATTTSEESVSMNAKLITKSYTPEESLRVSVVVKTSDKIATIYNVFCRKDLTNNATSLGFNSDGGIHFGAEMLRANFK